MAEKKPTYEQLIHAKQHLYKSSLYNTAKYLCNFKDVTRRTHGEMITTLEGSTKRRLICVPRGCLKSSLGCVAYPIWRLINNPNLRILIDSEVYTNSANFLREIKAIFKSEEFVSTFGGDPQGEIWKEGEIALKGRTVVKKEANITCSGVGAIKVGQHYDEIVGDDYNSNKNSLTPEGKKKIIDHFKLNMSILENDGIYNIIGTRYATDDIIGHIIASELSDEERALLPKGV